MWSVAALLLVAIQTEPAPSDRASLLQTFRNEFVSVTPGDNSIPKTFRMGGDNANEQPQRQVTIDYSFAVARYEVPQNLYESIMGDNPSRWKGPRNSVEMVSFDEAQEFCRRATKLMRDAKLITADQVVRLPSEAEWEYIARAGTSGAYSFGDDVGQLGDYAWFTGNAAGNDPPVGAKKPNPWGLYDIHGYLSEWCLDVGHDNYEGAPSDGSAWIEGGRESTRIIRGGSWKDDARLLRSAARQVVTQDTKDDAIGFRCVLAAELSAEPPGTE